MKNNLSSIGKPIFIKNNELSKFLKKNPHINYVDALDSQIKELFFIKNHEFIGENKKQVYKSVHFEKFSKKNENNYTYVYFPWNNTVVKTIKKNDYLALKTNRNQDLITKEEQEKLSNLKVGVFGMSVGSNIAFILTQAGISNSITIADFDELDTTNLNRILAGVHQIGLNKTIIASRHIYEDNPFAKVNLMQKGVNKKNLESLLKNKKLDCIIEEIDDLHIKIEIRFLANKYKVPVIMITDNGDGVVLHVERYDLGYHNIFDKDFSYWNDILLKPPSKELMGKTIIEDIVGGVKKVDPKMMKSVEKVFKKELVSWSQLGSAAILGGVVTIIALKKIINKENNSEYLVKNIFVL
jgi:molybdopterin/thiamine biosynthesis adenylyltransferase